MDANDPNDQGHERRQGGNGVPRVGSFEAFARCLPDGFVLMSHDRATFARQAAVLALPQNAEAMKSMTYFAAQPTAADEESALNMAQFLSNAQSLKIICLGINRQEDRRQERAEMAQSVVDLWLTAATHDDAVQLIELSYGAYAASLPTFQQFVRRKMRPKGFPLCLQASPSHLRNLTGYLDASLGLSVLGR